MTDALNADHITKVFGGLTAVDDVSLHVGEKELVALIGPNGAGKTTFFNCLTGVAPATTGTVKIGGQEVKKYQGLQGGPDGDFQNFPEHPPLQPVVRVGKCLDRLDQPL